APLRTGRDDGAGAHLLGRRGHEIGLLPDRGDEVLDFHRATMTRRPSAALDRFPPKDTSAEVSRWMSTRTRTVCRRGLTSAPAYSPRLARSTASSSDGTSRRAHRRPAGTRSPSCVGSPLPGSVRNRTLVRPTGRLTSTSTAPTTPRRR